MDRDRRPFITAIVDAQEKSRIAIHDWVKIVLTIMTPSLVLLIGLQENTLQLAGLSRVFLVLSIILMSLTILLSLLFLHRAKRLSAIE